MFRLDKEKDLCSWYYWLTLQYDQDHVPKTISGDLCFDKSHCRKFFEHTRIKYRELGITFKHFLVSEYGGNGTHRPHYHCLLMVYCPDHFDLKQKFEINREMRDYLIHQAWKYGHVTEKGFHGRVLRYLTKYCCKPELVGDYHEMPPFTLISPGIGEGYLAKLSSDRLDQIRETGDFSVRYGSGIITLPRYLQEKIMPSSLDKFRKALDSRDYELSQAILNNRSIKRKRAKELVNQDLKKFENQFNNKDFGLDIYRYLRLAKSNRDYEYQQFKTKIQQRKDL